MYIRWYLGYKPKQHSRTNYAYSVQTAQIFKLRERIHLRRLRSFLQWRLLAFDLNDDVVETLTNLPLHVPPGSAHAQS